MSFNTKMMNPFFGKILLSILTTFHLALTTTAQNDSDSRHYHESEESHSSHIIQLEKPDSAEEHDDEHGEDHGGDHDDHGEEHDDHGEEHGDEHDEHEGEISLGDQDIKDFGIRVAAAEAGIIHDELRLPGEVSMNENAMSHVSPRYAGIVTKIYKRIGDAVQTGELLAEMESNETLRPFKLIAPIDGTIVTFHITPGESLNPGDVAFTIADTSTVWVDLRVYQRDLPKVHKGQKVRISAGHEYPETNAEITYVGPVVDKTSRTGSIRAVLENPQGLYRPGLFVIGNVLLDVYRLPIVVPRSGVLTIEGKNIVFVQDEGNKNFEAREVELGRSDAANLEILSGLRPGERFVIEGGFFLKADTQKESFGDGHDH